jgi:hypothetical protein
MRKSKKQYPKRCLVRSRLLSVGAVTTGAFNEFNLTNKWKIK